MIGDGSISSLPSNRNASEPECWVFADLIQWASSSWEPGKLSASCERGILKAVFVFMVKCSFCIWTCLYFWRKRCFLGRGSTVVLFTPNHSWDSVSLYRGCGWHPFTVAIASFFMPLLATNAVQTVPVPALHVKLLSHTRPVSASAFLSRRC